MNQPAVITCIHGHKYTVPMWGECPKCQAERNGRHGSVVGEAVRRFRKLADSGDDQGAHAESKNLRVLGHPDVDGLVQSTRNRLEAMTAKSGGRRPRREDL